jgi:hypothetical protein
MMSRTRVNRPSPRPGAPPKAASWRHSGSGGRRGGGTGIARLRYRHPYFTTPDRSVGVVFWRPGGSQPRTRAVDNRPVSR